MLKKIFQISLISCACFTVSVVNAGTIDGLIEVAKNLTSGTANAAIGINTEKGNATIKAESTGAGSNSNAGLAVVDAGQGGKQANIAIGYNAGTANITATSQQGGSANAGLAVIKTR